MPTSRKALREGMLASASFSTFTFNAVHIQRLGNVTNISDVPPLHGELSYGLHVSV